MRNKIILLSLLVFCLFNWPKEAYSQKNANLILTKMDKVVFGPKDKTANIKMVLINLNNNKQKVKRAEIIQKGTNKKLFRYTYPKSDSGIATLSLPNDEVYLYLPLFKKAKRITNLGGGNIFNNSDFSFKDMATKAYAEKYTPKIRSTTDTSFVLNLIPKADNSAYSHVVASINKKYFYPELLKYYNKKGKEVKVAVYHNIKIDGFWIADVVSMTNLKKNHMTKIFMTDIKINRGLKDNLFTLKNLVGSKE